MSLSNPVYIWSNPFYTWSNPVAPLRTNARWKWLLGVTWHIGFKIHSTDKDDINKSVFQKYYLFTYLPPFNNTIKEGIRSLTFLTWLAAPKSYTIKIFGPHGLIFDTFWGFNNFLELRYKVLKNGTSGLKKAGRGWVNPQIEAFCIYRLKCFCTTFWDKVMESEFWPTL